MIPIHAQSHSCPWDSAIEFVNGFHLQSAEGIVIKTLVIAYKGYALVLPRATQSISFVGQVSCWTLEIVKCDPDAGGQEQEYKIGHRESEVKGLPSMEEIRELSSEIGCNQRVKMIEITVVCERC